MNLYASTTNPLRQVDLRGLSSRCPNGKDCPQNKRENREDERGVERTPDDGEVAGAKHKLTPQQAEALARAKAAEALADLQRRAALPKDHPDYLSKKRAGPVVVALVDRKTGRTFVAVNDPNGNPPANLHPTLKPRVTSANQDPQHESPSGAHAEVYAANDALHARDGDGQPSGPEALDDMHMMPLWTKGEPSSAKREGGMVTGEPAPRCGNCQSITDGVHNHSGDAPPRPPQ